MEECKGDDGSATNVSADVSGGGVSSRWNPTKEQISLLEGLYKQGIRTPSAEQIQQITGRLRVYGHIEGKNVFYWFQNHKARQRQKQKQESLVYFNRFLRAAAIPFVPPLPPPNVVCSPSYASHGGFGYAPYQKVLLPAAGGARRPRAERSDAKIRKHEQQGYGASDVGYGVNGEGRSSFEWCNFT